MSILNNAGHDFDQQPPAAKPKRSALDIQRALSSFDRDPPDTDFQRGYLAALQWVAGQDRPQVIPPRVA